MNNTVFNKRTRWMIPIAVLLFLLGLLAFPKVLSIAQAEQSESSEHILTYSRGKLIWDSTVSVDGQGAAEFSLFDTIHPNVKSGNGDKVIAPGTQGSTVVQLKNSAKADTSYIAVLYKIKTTEEIPAHTALSGTGFSDTEDYDLPSGVNNDQVIRAVSGTIAGGSIQDFYINWFWQFENGARSDEIDTLLGGKAANGASDNITVGLYITANDGSQSVVPVDARINDNLIIYGYIIFMFIVGMTLILLLVDRNRESEEEENA